MKKIVLSVSLVLAQMLAVSAIAQSKGEADPAQSKAIPSAKVSPAEKAAAKATRKEEGAKVAKVKKSGEADPSSLGKAKAATKEEKAAAKAKRKAEASAAVKKGEIPSGDKPAPEPKK